MPKVNVHEAKTQLSNLLQRVAAGDEITIANRAVPVARLVPLEQAGLGTERDRVRISSNFDEPLPSKLLAGFSAVEKRRRSRAER